MAAEREERVAEDDEVCDDLKGQWMLARAVKAAPAQQQQQQQQAAAPELSCQRQWQHLHCVAKLHATGTGMPMDVPYTIAFSLTHPRAHSSTTHTDHHGSQRLHKGAAGRAADCGQHLAALRRGGQLAWVRAGHMPWTWRPRRQAKPCPLPPTGWRRDCWQVVSGRMRLCIYRVTFGRARHGPCFDKQTGRCYC